MAAHKFIIATIAAFAASTVLTSAQEPDIRGSGAAVSNSTNAPEQVSPLPSTDTTHPTPLARGSGKSDNLTDLPVRANNGDVDAQYNLGVGYYYGGKGVSKDYSAAVTWFRKAADTGHPQSQCFLGLCYFKGNGVLKDNNEAFKWYRNAAEQGDAVAQSNVGACYSKGLGVAKDMTEAVKWCRKAADQGNAVAQCDLGDFYRDGLGVARDNNQAVFWYRKAADQGYAAASNVLARIDRSRTAQDYRQAAEDGHAQAQNQSGECNDKGVGVAHTSRNPTKTSSHVVWIILAFLGLLALLTALFAVIRAYLRSSSKDKVKEIGADEKLGHVPTPIQISQSGESESQNSPCPVSEIRSELGDLFRQRRFQQINKVVEKHHRAIVKSIRKSLGNPTVGVQKGFLSVPPSQKSNVLRILKEVRISVRVLQKMRAEEPYATSVPVDFGTSIINSVEKIEEELRKKNRVEVEKVDCVIVLRGLAVMVQYNPEHAPDAGTLADALDAVLSPDRK